MSANELPEWYYASENNERLGPVSIRELSALAGRGQVGPGTLVWSAGYPDWIPAERIADLLSAARVVAPPVPTPASEPAADGIASGPPPVPRPEASPAPGVDAPSPSAPPEELKPRKGSFVFRRILLGVLLSVLAGGASAGLLFSLEQPTWPALALILAGGVLSVAAGLAAYRKERYQIHESRVLCHRGGLVSDETTELEVRNITHVKIKLPWLRYKFFGVGDVIVESAGNSLPVTLQSIRAPESVYAGLRERMKRNGYDLKQRQLLHEEQPALIGILGECFGLLVGAVMACLLVGPAILGAILEGLGKEEPMGPGPVLTGLSLLAVCGLVAFVVVRFFDLRRRTYRVYSDVVVYEEGFLTRHNAFIPYENIADANTRSSFFDRLFGLYDVEVSCQGSGSDIKFRRLRNGIALSAAIDQLVVLARQKQAPSARPATGDKELAGRDRPRRDEPAGVAVGEAMVAELRMHGGRTLVPMLLWFPLVPLWIAAMIQSGIRLVSTRYSVRPGSVRHSYRFLTLHDREFAYDKITGVVILRNLWDRLFDTMTLRFWSIGSGQPLEFAHVSARGLDLPALLRQAGIPAPSAAPYGAKASFGVLCWLRSRLNWLPGLSVFAAGVVFAASEADPLFIYLLLAPVVVGVGDCIHSKLYHSRQQLSFHDHHIEAGQGIIARRSYYARYANVKRSTVTRYPGGHEGSLEIFVAGEEEFGRGAQQRQGQRGILKPCSFTSGFLPAAAAQGMLLDDILCGRVEPAPGAAPAADAPEVLLEATRSVGNSAVRLVILSIVLFPLVVLLPLTLPVTVMRAKRWRYRVEEARVVLNRGILYRSESSILLDRVDSLQQSQGPLNKMFKNGSVSIMTAGSSKPDLVLVDSPAYLALYQLIRERSR
jgi:membrane protein YdbS with pleckstrin-like domain